MADGLFGGAAFGFYPQLNRYRRGDPRDALNLPVDVTRGRFAGTMGTPTDIANFVRSPSPMEMFGDISYEPPAQLPYTTEHFLKELPMAPTSRLGQVAGQAASFAPMNPMPAVRGLQKVGGIVGEELAATLMGQRPGSMMSRVVPQPLFAVEPSLAQAIESIAPKPLAERVVPQIMERGGLGADILQDMATNTASNITQFKGFKNTTAFGKAKEVAKYLDSLDIPYTLNKSKTTNSAYLEVQTGKGDFDYPMQFRFSDHSTDLPNQNRQIFKNPKPDPNFDLDVFNGGGHDTYFAINKINELATKVRPNEWKSHNVDDFLKTDLGLPIAPVDYKDPFPNTAR